jgi:hypothetical protein
MTLRCLPRKVPSGAKNEDGAIESACIALHYANDEINIVGASGLRKMIESRAGNVYAAFPITAKIFTACIRARSDDRTEVEAARISGNESFREQHEFRALLGGFVCQEVSLSMVRSRSKTTGEACTTATFEGMEIPSALLLVGRLPKRAQFATKNVGASYHGTLVGIFNHSFV